MLSRTTTRRLREVCSFAILLGGLGSIATTAGAATAAAGATGQSADQSADNGKENLETILVTARRQEESLQEVPLSIAAVSAEDLQQRSIEDIGDLGQSTPNFHFSQQANGGRLGGVAFIRGVGQRDANSAYDPSVGMYVDGVYAGRAYGSNLDLMNIDRVEVLRGPQGTLFGKNTSGGAINIITKQPDLGARSGRLQVMTGSRDRFDILGSINAPLIQDRLALQVMGSRSRRDGYGTRLDGQEMADTHRQAARAQLLFSPNDTFSALLSGDWLEFDERNASYRLVDVNTSVSTIALLNTTTTQIYDERWLSPSDYFFNATGPNSARGNIWGGALTLTQETGWATLKSITAYRQMNVHNDIDTDGAPVVIVDKLEHVAQHQFSQELQASGSALGERLEWVLGAYYFQEQIDNPTTFPLLPALFGNSQSFTRTYAVENDSAALFAQGIYSLTERLRLTVGLRYTQDDKQVDVARTPYPSGPQTFALSGEYSSTAWSPRVGLDFRWTDSFMTYASVAQGAKNGGFNGQTARVSDFDQFDDEVVWTYEIGMRSTLFDERVRLNATAFYSDYSDLQLQINGATVINGAPVPFNVISNVPEANIKGGELELSVAAADGLTLTAGLGLTYGEYTRLPSDPEFIASGVITKDSKFSHMPEVAYTLGGEYVVPLSSSVDLTMRADYSYRGKIYYNVENTANLVQPAYGLLDARLTLLHTPSDISISLFGTNLTAESYIVGGFDDADKPNPGLGYAFVTQGAPREWGLSLEKRF